SSNSVRQRNMTRVLACSAVGVFLGLAPAVAETQLPPPDQPALDKSAQPSEAMPAQPSTPHAAMHGHLDAARGGEAPQAPGQSSQMTPEASPLDQASPSAPPALDEANPSSASSEMPKASESPRCAQI